MNYQMPMYQPTPGQAQPQMAPQYSTQPSTPQTTPGSYPDPAGQQTNTQPIGMYNGGGVPHMFNQTQMNPGVAPMSMHKQMGFGHGPVQIPPHIQAMNQKMQGIGHGGHGMMQQNPMMNGPRSMYADGDHIMMPKPKGGFVMAHFSKSELPALDEAQGKATYLPGTNIRHYKGLEGHLKNDHGFANDIHQSVRHLFEGGKIHQLRDQAAHMKHMGRGGDTEMALIGPHTKSILDHMAGGESINPHTGHPEYFSLGGVLGGIGKMSKKLLPMVSGAMSMMPNGGGRIGQMAGMANQMFGGGNQGGGQMPGFVQKGMDFMNNNPYGQALKMAGSHFMNTNPMAQQAKQRAQNIFSQGNGRAQQFMDSPFGRNIMNAGRTAMDAYQGGEDFGRAAARGISNFAQNYDNPYSHMARGMADQYSMPDQMGGGRGNMGRAVARGMDYASRQSNNPYAQIGGMMANTYANGPDYGYQDQGGGYSQGGYGNPAGMDQDMWDQL